MRKLSEFNARVLQRRGVLSCPEGCVCSPKSFCNMTYLKTDDPHDHGLPDLG